MSDLNENPPVSTGAGSPADAADVPRGARTGLRQRLWALRVLIAVGLAAFVIGGLGGVALAKAGANNDGGGFGGFGGFGGHGGAGRVGGPGGFPGGGVPGQRGARPNGFQNLPQNALPNGSSGRTP